MVYVTGREYPKTLRHRYQGPGKFGKFFGIGLGLGFLREELIFYLSVCCLQIAATN